MKIWVDNEMCTGHGRCAMTAPELYPLDDLGMSAIVGDIEVPVGLEEEARAGALNCPERAISIIDD